MGEELVSRTIQPQAYMALSNRMRDIAKKILAMPANIKIASRSSYISNQASELVSSSDEYQDITTSIPEVISEALDVFDRNIEGLISGELTGENLMRSRHGLWKRLMTEFPMSEYASLCASFLIKTGYLKGKVLEIGSGVGNTAGLIVDEVNDSFVRSDVGKDLNRLFAKGSYMSYDFNVRPTVRDFDTIFSTNAVHCALNKFQTLSYVYDMLKAGGVFVIAEGKPFTHKNTPWVLNMFYGMFDGWWNVSGFLERSEWIDLFRSAGFKDIGWSVLRAGRHDLGGLIWGKK